MSQGFDPLLEWLDIQPNEQPPHYYRLLGVGLFESDPRVIEAAADRRINHVRTFVSGAHAKQAQSLLSHLAAAQRCLLDGTQKAAYDAKLRGMGIGPANVGKSAETPLWRQPAIAFTGIAAGAVGLILLAIAVFALSNGDGDDPPVAGISSDNQPSVSGGDEDSADSSDGPTGAPSDTMTWNGNRYWFSPEPVVIQEALQMSLDTGGRLVVVSSAEENAIVAQHLKGKTYLGVRKSTGTAWGNSLQQRQVYFNWLSATPPSQDMDTLALMLPNGQWTTWTFDDTEHYVALEWGNEPSSAVSDSSTALNPGLASRDFWRQSGGEAVYRRTETAWRMTDTTREVELAESSRTNEYVELHDPKRDVWRRLYPAYAVFRRPSVSNKWSVLYPGDWRDGGTSPATGSLAQKSPPRKPPTDPNVAKPPASPDPGDGYAFRFTGRQNAELQNTRGLADIGRSFTAEMWFRPLPSVSAPENGFKCNLMSTWADGATTSEVGQGMAGWFLLGQTEYPAPGQQRETYRLVYTNLKGASRNVFCWRKGAPKPPRWRHVAVCSNTEDGNWWATLYVDGKHHLTIKPNDEIPVTRPSPKNLYLGFTPDHNGNPALNALVRAFRLSSNVRYRQEFTPPVAFERDAATLAMLDFHQPKADRILDLSGNRRDGIIASGEWVALNDPDTPVLVASRPRVPRSPVLPGTEPPKVPLAKKAVRLKVPAAGEQKQASEELREILGDQFDKAKTPQAKVELAKLLLETCEEEENPATIYVVLIQARDLSADSGDLITAFRAVDDLDRRFEIDLLSTKADTLKQLSANTRDPTTKLNLAETAADLGNQAAAADQYKVADSMFSMAVSLARNIKDTQLLRTVQTRKREIEVEERRWEKAESARRTLADAPDDPAANLVLGKYLCFAKAKWPEGLKYLAKSDDSALASVAQLDAQGPDVGKSQVAVADAWYTWAAEAADNDQNGAYLRAKHWYETASPSLAGFDKAKVKTRLEELADKVTPITTDGGRRFTWLDGPVGELRQFIGHGDGILDLSVSRNGRSAATSDEDGVIFLWDLETGKPIHRISAGTSYCHAVAIAPNEQFVVGNLQSDKLGVWNTKTAALTGQINTRYRVSDVVFSPDGRRLVWGVQYSSSTKPNIGIWDISANRALGQLRTDGYPSVLDISSDGRLLAVASTGSNRQMEIWSLVQGTLVQRLVEHTSTISDVAFSPDSRLVASAAPGTVIIWNVTSGKVVGRLNTESARGCVDFSPDGRRLVTGSKFYGEIQIWNVEDGTSIQRLSPPGPQSSSRYAQRVAFLPDPRGVLSGHYDGTVRLWRVPD